jgi:DNA-binding MarR family transcriptional regulator
VKTSAKRKIAVASRPGEKTAKGSTPDLGSPPPLVGIDGLADHVGYSIRRFQIWIFQDFIKTLSAVNIKPAQYSVLTVIDANAGLTQMALAKILGIERARLVHLLDSLEDRNLVKRAPSLTDRRSHALHLTPVGHASLRQFKMLGAEHERHVIEKIGKEGREQLLNILSVFRPSTKGDG